MSIGSNGSVGTLFWEETARPLKNWERVHPQAWEFRRLEVRPSEQARVRPYLTYDAKGIATDASESEAKVVLSGSLLASSSMHQSDGV
jgi:hypothetical protein